MKELKSTELKSKLIESIQGNKDSYRLFLNYIIPHIEKKVRLNIFYPNDRDDIVQECLMGIHKSLSTFSKDRDVMPWVNAIVRYKIINYIDKKTKLNKKETELDENIVTIPRFDKNSINEMMELINQLPQKLIEPVVLTKVLGHSTKEAAAIINIKENALRTRVSRGLVQLKKIYEKSL